MSNIQIGHLGIWIRRHGFLIGLLGLMVLLGGCTPFLSTGVSDSTPDAASEPIAGPMITAQDVLLPGQMVKNLHLQLDGHVVGYAFVVGQLPLPGLSFVDSFGQARTDADGPAQEFGWATKIEVASVSKLVTAVAAIRILGEKGVSIDSPIGPYLPSDWNVSNYVANITFSQLLSQKSGIKDYGNVVEDYAKLKAFFTQPVSPQTSTPCDEKDAQGNYIDWLTVQPPGQGITPSNMNYCYSNYNFAIFRILLPKVAGYAEDPDPSTRPQTLSAQYIQLVQQNEFDLVGQHGVDCKPPAEGPEASAYAFAYKYPGTTSGYDWGDTSRQCGADGWYLSVADMAHVLVSLNANDGQILSPGQFATMQQRGLGLDVDLPGELEKNGAWSGYSGLRGGLITTAAAIFGPRGGPPQTSLIAVLFINSDISGGPSDGLNAQRVLEKAYWGWGSGKAYFFKGSQYLRYDFVADKVDITPRSIAGNWKGWPADWNSGKVVGVNWGNGKVYFFRGSQFLSYDITADRVDGAPQPIAGNWRGWPKDWNTGIDAAVNWENGKIYFFKGNQYLRYDFNTGVDKGYPLPIAGHWSGFPAAFNSGIDAAVNWGNGKVYFFKGNKYLRYDIASDAADSGYPLSFPGKYWGNWPKDWNTGIDSAVNW